MDTQVLTLLLSAIGVLITLLAFLYTVIKDRKVKKRRQ